MEFLHSLRFRLSVLYLVTIMIPTVIIIFTMPGYYHNVISNETEILTESTLTALSRNIDTYLEDLDRLTLMPYFDQSLMDDLDRRVGRQNVSTDTVPDYQMDQRIDYSLSNYLQNTRNDILSAILITNDGTPFVTNKVSTFSTITPDYDFSKQSWYKKADAANGKVVFISSHPQDYFSTPPAPQVFSVARVIKDPNTQRRLAFIMADADSAVLEKIFNGINLNVSSISSLFDDAGNLIYSNQNISPELKKQIIDKKALVSDKGQSYVVVSKTIDRSKWNMDVLISNNEIEAKFRWIYFVGIMFAIGELILAFSLFIVFSRIITNPFRKMTKAMKEVEKGNLKTQLALYGKDEVSQLGIALNDMIIKLNDLIDREYRAVLSKRNAEYTALQSQIQPHFLYNTLNGFIGLNRLGERQSLEKAILALKGMLRYTLEHDDMTTISEEFLLLQRYCELQKIRFQDRLEVNLQYDEAVSKYKIPKLLIQPLLENAIIHGVEPLDRKGLITVQADLKETDTGKVVQIRVRDDGAGFDMKTVDINKSIGLSNIHERLMLAFGRASFIITSEVGSGTDVTIEIPEEDMKV